MTRPVLLFGPATLFLFACSSDATAPASTEHHTSAYPSCQAIIDACHPYDVGDGPIHECHDLASNGPEATCAAKKAECLTTCKPDGG